MLLFVYTWDEWFELTAEHHDEEVICPRCEPYPLAECLCLTPSLVEDRDYRTVEIEGRIWAMRKEFTDDEWDDEYGCVKSGEGVWHYDSLEDALKAANGDVNHLWTVVDGDGFDGRDCEWITPGNHIVNRISYLVSERPWTEDSFNNDYLWHEYVDEAVGL